jgi:nitrate reductase NapE component
MLRPRLCSELFTAPGSLQMRGAARPGSYQNQWKGVAISKPKPRRNRSNTIATADKTIPVATPIIPVTLITRYGYPYLPLLISSPPYSITSSARASSLSGTVRPSILAVWWLMTSSRHLGLCLWCSMEHGSQKEAGHSVHGWFSDNKEWIEFIVAAVVLWLLTMTAISVFDLRSAG